MEEENIVNIGTFIQHLTYYVKMGIYVNKGTTDDTVLERCIKLHNKYKTIEGTTNIKEKDEALIRRCLKRLNLILKVNPNGNPVDIKDKNNQSKMIYLKGHSSLNNNDMEHMIKYSEQHKINILTDIPLGFMLKESKYQDLLWQYTRALFYISQILISKTSADADLTDPNIKIKKEIYDESMDYFEEVLEAIAEIEEKMQMNQVMAMDTFLKNTLKTGITKERMNDARSEVEEIFKSKGLENDSSMGKMIGMITNELEGSDFSQGNIIQTMFGIAQNVANEMRGELEQDPEKFQNTLGAITEIFQETMENPETNEEVPEELKNMMGTLFSSISNGENQTEEELNATLENIIQSNGLDRDQFLSELTDENGEVKLEMLEKYLVDLNES